MSIQYTYIGEQWCDENKEDVVDKQQRQENETYLKRDKNRYPWWYSPIDFTPLLTHIEYICINIRVWSSIPSTQSIS